MLKIGDFSKLSRVSIRMLRHYDEIGILKPCSIDPFTGYRYYSEDQLPIAGRIAALRDMGFSLADTGEILKCYGDREVVDQYLRVRQAELTALMEQTAIRLRLLESARKRLRKDDNSMEYNVTLKTLPERCAASVRMTIPSYDQEGMMWSILVSETAPLNIQADDPCYCSATFYDREYKEHDVDVEVQKTVKGRYPDTEHVRFKIMPPVTVASATYKGSYSKVGEVNAAVAAWIRDNNYEYDGPAFFIYHVSPHETQNPDEFVTEICYPVKKK
ncbi:MAG: MerR family transcriptional regulator [Butyricicoccaceae bacterium]